jgi:hypothetical protein
MSQASIKGLLLDLCALFLGARCDVHRALTLPASHRARSLKQVTTPAYRHCTRDSSLRHPDVINHSVGIIC